MPDADPMSEFRDRAVAAMRAAMGLGSAPLGIFRKSMEMNYEKWHDGVGYDLDALRQVPVEDHAALYSCLVPPQGWRDVEALAAMHTTHADDALRTAATESPINEVRLWVANVAPHLVDGSTRLALLRRAIETATFADGMVSALDQIEPADRDALGADLLRGLLTRDGTLAYHFAATLAFMHGIIPSRDDTSLRPLFLQFNTPDVEARRGAYRELCERIGVEYDQ